MREGHREPHRIDSISWLRGANNDINSTAADSVLNER